MTKSPDSKIRVKWNLGKDQERSVYDTNLIKIENGEIITTSLESCTLNLQLEKPWYPGANAPPVEKSDIFKNVAKRIKPSREVEKVIPKEKYVTIHIRGKDKFSDQEHPIMTTRAQFEEYKTKCIEYVKSHREKNYFVCSDDEELKKQFINECGDGIKFIELDYRNLDRSVVDLFVMSRSELVIQCTRYSTFSIVASIIGGIPLLNFSGDERIGDVVDWKPFIYKRAVWNK
jgi:rRNA-processing protein FCF1